MITNYHNSTRIKPQDKQWLKWKMKAKKLYFWKENTSNSEGKLKIQEKPVFTKKAKKIWGRKFSNICKVLAFMVCQKVTKNKTKVQHSIYDRKCWESELLGLNPKIPLNQQWSKSSLDNKMLPATFYH